MTWNEMKSWLCKYVKSDPINELCTILTYVFIIHFTVHSISISNKIQKLNGKLLKIDECKIIQI